jgi:hypothetical protein
MLSNLKLSSLNNSVVGISHETQHLLENFTVVLKDVVGGGQDAYEDLDKLLNERGEQLDNLFGSMPPFVQTLVKSLPVKMYGAMAPQVAAAMSSEGKTDLGLQSAEVTDDEDTEVTVSTTSDATVEGKDGKMKKKRGIVPSVQSLIKEQGTVAAMLRSILNFLQARFPLFVTGSNVLMSLAVFILLFVFWYCHKRGKQVRLSKKTAEKIAAEASLDDLEKQVPLEDANQTNKDAEQEKKEAEKVPLPEADQTELQTGEKTKESEKKANEPKEAEKQDFAMQNTNNTTKIDEKQVDSGKSENKTKMTGPPATQAKPDDETLQKLLDLQQKSVDEALPGNEEEEIAADGPEQAEEAEEGFNTTTANAEEVQHKAEAVDSKAKSKDATMAPPKEDAKADSPAHTVSAPVSTEDNKAIAGGIENAPTTPASILAAPDSDTSTSQEEDGKGKGPKISFDDLLKALVEHAQST